MTRETKHTPGPWVVDHDDTPWTCGDARTALEHGEELGHTEILFAVKGGETGDDWPLAYCPWEPLADEERQEELRGNARLIAAAPEMLECLRKCVEFLEDEIGASACLEKTRAILAKIEGGAE